ncbi:hypothetical protein [Methyloceanibacter sp.]|uniref:hypothetical protein n=1 Tax=Methyloceanibacter sp. TaxID=1965321 RepID=UPI00208135A7|nr:hypothetical protein [Methyloceanibacter sp.]GFO82801.1 MAG: hypothetical protein A49_24280 [Methyloceanibacter sp.]HML91069.1 hypothetical protein [Methyloceanibacter sp.]
MMFIAMRKRQQSELCRRLARLADDGEVQARLIQTADDYLAEAAYGGSRFGGPRLAGANKRPTLNFAYD